jgi:putative transcriptional regulator
MIKFNLHPDNELLPEKGRLLIAEPFMDDPYFGRTVVLICEHNEEGTYGFILNKPTEVVLSDVFPELANYSNPVGIGGPVNSERLHYLHTAGDRVEDAEHVIHDIYTGGDFERIKELLLTGQLDLDEIKFFVGYSGWEEYQLDAELAEHSWFVAECEDSSILQIDDSVLWKSVLKKMGGDFGHVADFPQDPTLN